MTLILIAQDTFNSFEDSTNKIGVNNSNVLKALLKGKLGESINEIFIAINVNRW